MSGPTEPRAAASPVASAGVKRRDFLKILSVGATTAATVGCGTEHVKNLVPYLTSPDETVPGVSTYYASTCRECASACGVLIETRDGRVIKIEGNPAHPLNRGALCARGQAAPQGLYNPDRYRQPMMRRGTALVPVTWVDALRTLGQRLGEVRSRGQASGAAFVNLHESGAFPNFLDQWLSAMGLPPHLSYDPDLPSAVLAANRQSYGVSWPGLDFSAAQVIVSFGADFLDTWGASVPQQLDWADARAKLAGAPRLIYVGARRSLTGLNADEWVPAKPGSELAIANAILTFMGGVASHGPSVSIADAATASGVDSQTLQRLASSIARNKPSLALAGGGGPDAEELALAVNAINQAAGNVGQTVKPGSAITAYEGAATYADVRDLVDRMNRGAVPLLLVRGANPAYSTPRSLGFAAAMAKVPFKVSFSSYPDETAELCDLVLPDHHALESWGEAAPLHGTLSLQQPGMDPVFDSRPTGDVLLSVAKADASLAAKFPWPDYRTWLIDRFPGGVTAFTNALPQALATGEPAGAGATVKGTSKTPAPPPRPVPPKPAPAIEQARGDFYLVVYPSATVSDGRGANKPWLQELPDPVTKIGWQTVAELHPETARRLGITAGDHLRVETDAGSIEAAAFIYLGVRPDTVAVALGRGHTAYGRYAKGVGANALDLLGSAEDRAGGLALTSTKARITTLGVNSHLVSTEGSARQHGRGIARAVLASALASEAGAGGGASARARRRRRPFREMRRTRFCLAFARRWRTTRRATTATRTPSPTACTTPRTGAGWPSAGGR